MPVVGKVTLEEMLKAARVFTDTIGGLMPGVSTYKLGQGPNVIATLERAVLCRQYEALVATLRFVNSERGEFSVPLLRPQIEELIWVTYIKTLPPKTAERMISCFATMDIEQALLAQQEYVGEDLFDELGLVIYLDSSLAISEDVRKSINSIADELGWPNWNKKTSTKPSFAYLSKQTGHYDLYKFLYMATSRFVHFSVPELYRRVWYDANGVVTISSSHYRAYWTSFAVVNSIRLLLKTIEQLYHHLPDEGRPIGSEEMLAAVKLINDYGNVPIITSDELRGSALFAPRNTS